MSLKETLSNLGDNKISRRDTMRLAAAVAGGAAGVHTGKDAVEDVVGNFNGNSQTSTIGDRIIFAADYQKAAELVEIEPALALCLDGNRYLFGSDFYTKTTPTMKLILNADSYEEAKAEADVLPALAITTDGQFYTFTEEGS